jgi:galactokinase
MARTPAEIIDTFRRRYPTSDSPRIFRAPGRVNLIGEHTDYNLGLVLPMALDLACYVATAPSNDGWLRAYSEQLAQGAQWRIDDLSNAVPRGDWSDRVAGVAWELTRRGMPPQSLNVLIDSTVPLGSGLSSSAALGVSLAVALSDPGEPLAPLELAKIAHAAETDFVGVPCGIMDQFAAAHGVEGAGLLLDCRSLEWRAVKLPADVAVIAANTMVKHELNVSAYRTRVEECGRAARTLGVASLREVTLDSLDCLSGAELKRARHIITENARVKDFAAAADVGDAERMGRVMVESHASLRDDYEVSCAELDFLVESAMSVPGVLGARMTGGGFGGCTVNLVPKDEVENLRVALTSQYAHRFGRLPELYDCRPSAGASQVFP